MSVLAHFEYINESEEDRRGSPRLLLRLGSSLASCGSSVVIHDLSATGLLFETSADLGTGDRIDVQLPEMGPMQATVMWNNAPLFGCQFRDRIPKAALSAALLRSEATPSPQQRHLVPGPGRLPSGAPADYAGGAYPSTLENEPRRIGFWIAAAIIIAGVASLRSQPT